MYFRITEAVTASPVARTKYPELHKGPPHVVSFISGCSFMSRTQDTLFNTWTSSAGLHRGGALTNRCTWSGITACSTISNPYRSAVPLNIRLSALATGSSKIALRNFGTQTIWYLSSYTAWLVRPYSTPNTVSPFAPAHQEGCSSAPARGAVSARGTRK